MAVDRDREQVVPPRDLAEEIDLPSALQDEILSLDARLGTIDHWQLLGIPWNAPPAAVRAAYVEKVKVFHPDRHAGRRLGSFLPRIERVFRALTAARDALCDPATRDGYVRDTAPPVERARMEVRRADHALRAQERRARLARANPLVARATRIQELLERGRRAMAAGNHAQAANDFLTVAGLDPRHPEARALADEARRHAGAGKARALYEQAVSVAAVGRPSAAIAMLRDAAEADPTDARYPLAAARIALQRGDAAEARGFAEQAVRIAPRAAQGFEVLGQALHALGDSKQARRAIERALELDPDRTAARELARKLRWSVFR